jgi:ABC-type Na+ efflux pump permease subunit
MNWKYVGAIAKKDLLEVLQNRAAWMPMIILPLIFVLVLPLVLILLPQFTTVDISALTSDVDMQIFMDQMPPTMLAGLDGLDEVQKVIVLLLGFMFAPFFMIFPLAFSSIVGAESFAGERERKTMEALLYTAATDVELFLGKVSAALVPAIGISWGSFLGYTAVLNIAAYPLFGRIWFPLPTWWPLIFWITPALALLSISATVLISARVQTFMGAYQLSASLVVIVVALLVGQISGVVYLTVGVGMMVGFVFWVFAGILLWLALRGFNRSELLTNIKA